MDDGALVLRTYNYTFLLLILTKLMYLNSWEFPTSFVFTGDAMGICNGQLFSTKDRDNDLGAVNCAVKNEGAWWYNACHKANLNGRYITGGRYTDRQSGSFTGIDWEPWKGYGYSLLFTEMKLRPTMP